MLGYDKILYVLIVHACLLASPNTAKQTRSKSLFLALGEQYIILCLLFKSSPLRFYHGKTKNYFETSKEYYFYNHIGIYNFVGKLNN